MFGPPSVGRIVHFVMPNGAHRPALVVESREGTFTCNLQVFTDGFNDHDNVKPDERGDRAMGVPVDAVIWRSCVERDEMEKRDGTWHWPERD